MKIRPATKNDIAAIGQVHFECWRALFSGLVPEFAFEMLQPHGDARWLHFLEGAEWGDEVAFVAEEDGKVVGFAAGGPEWGGHPTIEAEMYSLYVLPQYQGKGVGKHLLLAVAKGLVGLGLNSMLVRLRSGNPTPRVYIAMGAEDLGLHMVTVGNATVGEVTYGWQDLRQLSELE
ncbi:MAG: GNAT family N-acetyltransferase [Deinococcales bacterium]